MERINAIVSGATAKPTRDSRSTPREVLFERDVGRGVDLESLVAARDLALSARKRVLLVGLRMQEHREILAHRFVAEAHHLLRRAPDHHIVAVCHRQAEQLVAHRSADSVDFHASLPSGF
jgi:hypothetical protein